MVRCYESLSCVRSDIYQSFGFLDSGSVEVYTLSLHDALPICSHEVKRRRICGVSAVCLSCFPVRCGVVRLHRSARDRKSTRLNSSHRCISYAVFCLKKKSYSECSMAGSNHACSNRYKENKHDI